MKKLNQNNFRRVPETGTPAIQLDQVGNSGFRNMARGSEIFKGLAAEVANNFDIIESYTNTSLIIDFKWNQPNVELSSELSDK